VYVVSHVLLVILLVSRILSLQSVLRLLAESLMLRHRPHSPSIASALELQHCGRQCGRMFTVKRGKHWYTMA
jgi:hypothetical protein